MEIDPKLIEENRRLLHAVQSGVKAKMEAGISRETEPKHLRVGINNALLETSALTKIMIDKGLFTPDEYFSALNKLLAEEVKCYEDELTEHYGGGTRISLA